jgi:hypothetical protein
VLRLRTPRVGLMLLVVASAFEPTAVKRIEAAIASG